MTPTVSGLYWRKSLWNGFASIPVILRLDGNTLTLKTRKGIEWQVFISDTLCRFTPFGTMIITANGKDFAFVTAGAAVSRGFSKEQLQELSNPEAHYAAGSDAAVSIGVGASTVGPTAPLGAALATTEYAHAASANIDIWGGVYRSLGLLTASKGTKNVTRNLILLVVGSCLLGIVALAIYRSTTQ